MAPQVVGTLRHGLTMVAFPWQVDFDEGVVLHMAYLIAQGQNPYPALEPDRFVSSPYPPLYGLLVAIWQGTGRLDMGFGRALSLVSSVLAASATAWLAARVSRSPWAGIAAGSLFLGNGLVWVWGSFQKPDMLALALELVGLCMVATGRTRWQYGAVVPLVLAIFTKQSAVAGLAASAAYMVVTRRRGAVGWLGVVVGLVSASYAALEVASRGGYTLHTILLQAVIPWRWIELEYQLRKLWTNNGALALAGLVGWVLSWIYPRLRLMSFYGLVALLETGAINGRAGVNYGLLLPALPTLAIFSTAMPLALGLSKDPWSKAAGVGLAALLLLAAGTSASGERWYSLGRMPEVVDGTRYLEMTKLVAEQPGPALSENSQILLKAGKEVLFDDTFMMGWAARSGLWDGSAFVRMLEERRFGVLLFEKDPTRLDPRAQSAMGRSYYLAYRDYLNIWLPKRQ